MKIGILSMHRVANYGSFLQAYGLKKLIEADGHKVVFIDFKVGRPVVAHSGANVLLTKIKMLYPIEPLWERFKYYILGKRNFRTLYRLFYQKDLGIGEKYRRKAATDAVVIGSDEVFNCLQQGSKVGFSPMLFGQGLETGKIISYAASLGYTTAEGLREAGVADLVGSWLKRFAALSVRDRNSYETIKELTGREAEEHLDPVLVADYELPDVSHDDYKQLDVGPEGETGEKARGSAAGVPEGPYAVLYTYVSRPYSDEERSTILNFCRNNSLELVSFGETQSWVPRRVEADPLTMLAYFSRAAFVITDTFHGTVFAIKYNRNFVTRVRDNNREKLGDLLVRLGQEERRIETFDDLQTYYDSPPDFEETNKVIAKEKERTRQYLREQLAGKE